MNKRSRIVIVAAAFIFAAIVGVIAYNLGLENSAGAVAAGGPHYHHYWHGGPWLFIPLFFLAIFAMGGGRGHRCAYYGHRGEQDNPDRR